MAFRRQTAQCVLCSAVAAHRFTFLLALLAQSLRAGGVACDAIVQFPLSFSGLASVAFISVLNHRSIDLSGDELKLKQLLESAGH